MDMRSSGFFKCKPRGASRGSCGGYVDAQLLRMASSYVNGVAVVSAALVGLRVLGDTESRRPCAAAHSIAPKKLENVTG